MQHAFAGWLVIPHEVPSREFLLARLEACAAQSNGCVQTMSFIIIRKTDTTQRS